MTSADRGARTLSLKIDVCTRAGFLHGVPRLLEPLARRRVRASFFLAMGPDESGRALRNVLRPGFLRKMVATRAPALYGWKTVLYGTLLPAPPIATSRPDLVRRIEDEGHEVAIHGFRHRVWQDELPRMDEATIRAEFTRACEAFHSLLGRAPRATGAPAWCVSPASLRLQDEFGFAYASDLRGGPPCRVRADGRELATIQVATTGLCLEELLASGGSRDPDALASRLLDGCLASSPAVLAVHAEVEGGPHLPLFERVLDAAHTRVAEIVPLEELARRLDRSELPLRELDAIELPGRSGLVAASRACAGGFPEGNMGRT